MLNKLWKNTGTFPEERLLGWFYTLTILGRKGGSTWRWFSWAQSISLKKGCLKMACSPP